MKKHFLLIVIGCCLVMGNSAQVLPTLNSKPQTPPVKKEPPKPASKPSSVVPSNKYILKILCNSEAKISVDGEVRGTAKPGVIFKLALQKGMYRIEVFSLKYPVYDIKETYRVENNYDQDLWNVDLKEMEEKYIAEGLANIINSCLLTSYEGVTNTEYDFHISVSNSIIANANNIVMVHSSVQNAKNSGIYSNSTSKYEIDPTGIYAFYIESEKPGNVKYSGTSRLLYLIGKGRYEYNEKIKGSHSENDITHFSIPIKAGCESDLRRRLEAYFLSLNISSKKPVLTCSLQEVFNMIQPCFKETSECKLGQGYRGRNEYSFSFLSNRLILQNKIFFYDKDNKLFSEEMDETELDGGALWGFSIESYTSTYCASPSTEYSILFTGYFNVKHMDNKHPNENYIIKQFSVSIPIRSDCASEVEAKLNSCFKNVNNN